MSRMLSAYLKRNEVPGRQTLQEAIDAYGSQGHALVLDDGYVPFQSAGYLPCTPDGEDAGFELSFGTQLPGPEDGGRDAVMTLRWGGDPREQAAAFIVCAALAGNFGAIVRNAQESASLGAAQLLMRARAGLA